MAKSPKPFVGGMFILFGLLIGAGVGIALGQPSAGVVIGLATGSLAALAKLIWDRRS
jgi:hypothetical protein